MANAVLALPNGRLKLGPSDCGRRLTKEQFLRADYHPGFRYELIHGRLYVVTVPRLPHDWLEQWITDLLEAYAESNPAVINYISNKAAVHVPGESDVTRPEPDLAAYRRFPIGKLPDVNWNEVSPILVVEVLSEDSLEKDLVRNLDLYHQVPSIREYWVLNGLPNPAEPSMKAYRRHGKGWREIQVWFMQKYTTRLLPGFQLKLNPKE